MNSLIPDLPEEIALECLIRVPHQSLPVLRRVCRRWKESTESPLFHQLRRSSNSSGHLIVLSQLHHSPSPSFKKPKPSPPILRLAALQPSSPLPLTPFFPRGLPLFSRLAASGPLLFLIGGCHPDTFAPSNSLFIYSFLSANWRRAAPMPGPSRSFFACSASPSGLLFIAGGHDPDKNALNSALLYHVEKDEWTALPHMAVERDECAAVFDAKAGLFRVVGGYGTLMQGRFERSAEAFDAAGSRWGPVEEVPEGECSNRFVVGGDGRLYLCGGGKKMVFVKQGEEWREFAELPEDVRVDTKMVAFHGGLMAVGSGSSGGAQAAFVIEMKQGVAAAAAGWRRVEIPMEFSGHVVNACCVDI